MNTNYSKVLFVVFVVLAASIMIFTADARELLQLVTDNDVFNNNQGNIPINIGGGDQVSNVATTGGRNN